MTTPATTRKNGEKNFFLLLVNPYKQKLRLLEKNLQFTTPPFSCPDILVFIVQDPKILTLSE